jgi:hypothetical protein
VSEQVTKKDVLVFAGFVIAMLGSLIYGFFFAGAGQTNTCWNNYTTEEQAILNCEN